LTIGGRRASYAEGGASGARSEMGQRSAVYSPFMTDNHPKSAIPKFRVGDLVEVRSADEILLTLDERGALDYLPFMPEMLRFCGQRFRVVKRAEKACTAVDGTVRQVQGAVHLHDVRCDGSAHGGCEASCLLYWKEEWLKPVVLQGRRNPAVQAGGNGRIPGALFGPWNTVDDLFEHTTCRGKKQGSAQAFYCQATAIPEFGYLLPPWDVRQYVRDVKSGNVKLLELVRGLAMGLAAKIRSSLYGKWRQPPPTRTPASSLEFEPGDIVEIRSLEEIEATLDRRGRNRGLSFTPEMRELCGRRFRVSRRIHKIIDERTAQMVQLTGGCLILEGAICRGDRHRFCPRMAHLYWRDIWLRGVHVEAPATLTKISTIAAPRAAGAIAASASRASGTGS
jgi:hypothetical protein